VLKDKLKLNCTVIALSFMLILINNNENTVIISKIILRIVGMLRLTYACHHYNTISVITSHRKHFVFAKTGQKEQRDNYLGNKKHDPISLQSIVIHPTKYNIVMLILKRLILTVQKRNKPQVFNNVLSHYATTRHPRMHCSKPKPNQIFGGRGP